MSDHAKADLWISVGHWPKLRPRESVTIFVSRSASLNNWACRYDVIEVMAWALTATIPALAAVPDAAHHS